MITPDVLVRLLPGYLPRQRWFGAGGQSVIGVEIPSFEVWRDEWPGLVWALVDATLDDGTVARFQVFVGLRSVDTYEHFLDGKGRWLLGDVHTRAGEALAYDALVDGELVIELLHHVAPELHGQVVRPLTVEQTNTSVVIDDRWILKVFRRIQDGPNPDVEVPERLWAAGFQGTPEPVASWRHNGLDLAAVRGFLAGATEGLVLASTSLRDLFSSRLPPEESGGDFAPEARRLGQVLASMHAALIEVYGATAAEPESVAAQLRDEVARVDVPGVDTARLEAAVGSVAGLPDVGAATRIHGDLHLGQVMRSDSGWYVLDFEGEPVRSIAERTLPASPLRDLAGMVRSFQYAAAVVLAERGDEADDELRALATAWEERVRRAFVEGYLDSQEVAAALPAHRADLDRLLRAFVLAKAVYEVGYERAHRPEMEHIPVEAVQLLLARMEAG